MIADSDLQDGQLRLLETQVDPRGLRFLEALTGAPRRQRLRALASEAGPA